MPSEPAAAWLPSREAALTFTGECASPQATRWRWFGVFYPRTAAETDALIVESWPRMRGRIAAVDRRLAALGPAPWDLERFEALALDEPLLAVTGSDFAVPASPATTTRWLRAIGAFPTGSDEQAIHDLLAEYADAEASAVARLVSAGVKAADGGCAEVRTGFALVARDDKLFVISASVRDEVRDARERLATATTELLRTLDEVR